MYPPAAEGDCKFRKIDKKEKGRKEKKFPFAKRFTGVSRFYYPRSLNFIAGVSETRAMKIREVFLSLSIETARCRFHLNGSRAHNFGKKEEARA